MTLDEPPGATTSFGSVTSPIDESSAPPVWRGVDGFSSPTSPITGPCGAGGPDRLRPARGAQRVPAAHRRRALPGARPRPDVLRRRLPCCSPATARRPRTAAGRSAAAATSGSAAGRATSTPRGRRPRRVDPAAARPAAHPRGAAADPVHAEGGDRPGQRLGGRRRAQPARGLRPDPGQRRARPVQADRRRRRLASTAGFGSAYLARQVGQKFAREIFFLGDVYDAEDAYRMGMVNRVVPHAELETRRPGVGAQDLRQEPDRAADAEVRLQRRSTTGWSASRSSPARRPGWRT